MKKNDIFSTSTQILESVYVPGHPISGISKVDVINNKKMTVLLNLRSISFIGNRSLFFITQYWFYGMKEMDWWLCESLSTQISFCLLLHAAAQLYNCFWHNKKFPICWCLSLLNIFIFYALTVILGLQIRVGRFKFSYFSIKTYVVGTQKNSLVKTVLLSVWNIRLHWWVKKYMQFYSRNIILSGPVITENPTGNYWDVM